MPAKRFFLLLLLLAALALTTIPFTRAALPFPITNYVGNDVSALQITSSPSGLPNLLPSTPPGWDSPLVPSFIIGTNTTESLYAGLGVETYFDWAILNASDAPISTPTTTCLTIDGNPVTSWITPAYTANTFTTLEDFAHAVPEPGTFTVTLTADCTGQLAESDETDNTWEGEFTWSPYVSIIISDEHGLDKCEIATTSQMNVWWNESPYRDANIYIGGIARACSNTGLTSSWVSNVVERGWNLIPTWVGPQAPCASFNNRFSANPGTAREQGRREADAAVHVAASLGLIPPGSQTILYYDLEAFPNNKLCRTAAGQFLSGWTARLHELSQQSGIYGAGCGSYPTDWPNLASPPDAVWLAHWIFSDYTPSATVWDVACVPNTLWDNNERIRQYAGGHSEEWGGVALNIDSNVALGPVVGINPSLQANLPTLEESFGSLGIMDMQLLAPDQGWILQDGKLLWKTPDDLWTDLTPSDTTALAAFFLNPTAGWIASRAASRTLAGEGITLDILHTPDSGKTWQPAGTLSFSAPDAPGNIWLHFIDTQTGWSAIQLPSSSNFSLGQLFRTTDGGQTWIELSLPIGAPVYFVDAQTGWTAGGANGDELYVTHDGGESWSGLELIPGQGYYDLPTFVNGTGLLSVTIPEEGNQRVAFFISQDAGQTWQPASEIPVPTAVPMGTKLPVSILDAFTWFIANPETGALFLTQDAGKTITLLNANLPVQIVQFVTPEMGWALTFSGVCTGAKESLDFQCSSQMGLWQTDNGGEIWATIAP
jgi:photosystem II stability/assembly factor-like uncharacterized protein